MKRQYRLEFDDDARVSPTSDDTIPDHDQTKISRMIFDGNSWELQKAVIVVAWFWNVILASGALVGLYID